MYFGGTVRGNASFKISIPIVHCKHIEIDFCKWTLYLMTLINSLISSRSFVVDCLKLFTDSIMSSLNEDLFLPFKSLLI